MKGRLGRGGLGAFVFTALLLTLVVAATAQPARFLFDVAVAACVIGSIVYFMAAFAQSRFFALALGNALAVYACVFALVVEANFAAVGTPALTIGVALPIVAFMVACRLKRELIRTIIASEELPGPYAFARAVAWLWPVAIIGALTFLVPELKLERGAIEIVFVLAMALVAAIVAQAGPHVAAFLIDIALLFEEFFARIRHVIVPTFAFLTFYSVFVVLFGAGYRIVDRLTPLPNFRVGDETRVLTFSESLYFSVITMATVGYGDIVPITNLSRTIAAIQVVLGVLLLLFGFTELMAYVRERRGKIES
jgi:voltage-gated potassium channel